MIPMIDWIFIFAFKYSLRRKIISSRNLLFENHTSIYQLLFEIFLLCKKKKEITTYRNARKYSKKCNKINTPFSFLKIFENKLWTRTKIP